MLAQALAEQVGQSLSRGSGDELQRVLHRARSQPEILAVAVRTLDGTVQASAGDLARLPAPYPDERSGIDRMLVPIERDHAPWGRVEIAFEPAYPQTLRGWLLMPASLTVLGFVVIGVPLYGLYLRRALQLLDPNSAVPGRVRAAFDTLGEGVVVLDRDDRVVLANQVFRDMVPPQEPDVIGRRFSDLAWLVRSLDWSRPTPPWTEAVEHDRPVENVAVVLPMPAAGSTPADTGAAAGTPR